jgi:hypothetical protein
MGIPEYEAKRFEGAVKGGGTLLSVHCDTSDEISRAKEALKDTGAHDIASSGEEGSDSSHTHTTSSTLAHDDATLEDKSLVDPEEVLDQQAVTSTNTR